MKVSCTHSLSYLRNYAACPGVATCVPSCQPFPLPGLQDSFDLRFPEVFMLFSELKNAACCVEYGGHVTGGLFWKTDLISGDISLVLLVRWEGSGGHTHFDRQLLSFFFWCAALFISFINQDVRHSPRVVDLCYVNLMDMLTAVVFLCQISRKAHSYG